MRGRVLPMILALTAAGAAVATGVWLRVPSSPPAGATRGALLYADLCTPCHGADGRGAWRATLTRIDPGNLADRARMAAHADAYLFDLVKHGGAPIGRPGMPAFGATLGDDDIRAVIAHLRTLGSPSAR